MKVSSINRDVLAKFLATELQTDRVRDYCPNGLQVEGRSEIKHLVTGVTASLALIEEAVRLGADALMVHHGYFWRGEDPRVVGQKQKRLKLLLENEISLFAYHLPLDIHPTLGNNACLARELGLLADGRFGEDGIGWLGRLRQDEPVTMKTLAMQIEARLGRKPLLIGDEYQIVDRLAWCTGAAQSMFDQAIAAGANVYLSGEISEPTVHLAREAGVAYIACGHHATERYGIEALGEFIADKLNIAHTFVDIDNPV